jgi:hypothetical protein
MAAPYALSWVTATGSLGHLFESDGREVVGTVIGGLAGWGVVPVVEGISVVDVVEGTAGAGRAMELVVVEDEVLVVGDEVLGVVVVVDVVELVDEVVEDEELVVEEEVVVLSGHTSPGGLMMSSAWPE